MKKNSQQWKINNKFAKFKDFIKTNGLDYVDYNKLTSHEKRVYNGVKTYQTRVIYQGKFIDNKTFLNNPKIKEFAKNNDMPVKDYLKANYKDLKKFIDSNLLTRSINDKNIESFILKHNGKFFLNAVSISASDLIEFIAEQKLLFLNKKPNMYFTAYYNFIVKNFGKDLFFVSAVWVGSKGKKTVNF